MNVVLKQNTLNHFQYKKRNNKKYINEYMIQLDIDDKTYNIASSYEELTLGQYVDIIKMNESKIKLDTNEATVKIIAIISDQPKELEAELWKMNISDFTELTSNFDWIADTTVLQHIKELKQKEELIINGQPYGIISNYNQMNLGEVISFETLMNQEQSDYHRLDYAFGVLLRPIKDGKLVEFTQEVFEEVMANRYNVKMIDIYATVAFFLSGEKISTINNTKRFSIRK